MRLDLSRQGVPEFLCILAFLAVSLSAGPLLAQVTGSATVRGSVVEQFDASGADGKLLVSPETSSVQGYTLTARTALSYARSTTIYNRSLDQDEEPPERTSLVTQFSTVLGVSLAWDVLRLNLDLPVTLGQGFDDGTLIDFVIRRTALGDARVGLSVEAISQDGARPSVALFGKLWAPTGRQSALNSSGRVRYAAGFALSADYPNFGYRAAVSRRQQGDQPLIGSDIAWSLGVFTLLGDFQFGLETWGSSAVDHQKPIFEKETTHNEVLLSAFYNLSGWRFGLAAGSGFGVGVGTPAFRGVATLQIPLLEALRPPHPAPIAQPPLETRVSKTIHLEPAIVPAQQPTAKVAPLSTPVTSPTKTRSKTKTHSKTKTKELANPEPQTDCSRFATGSERPKACAPKVVVSGRQISVRERVRFETGRNTIDSVSYPLLTEVKNALQAHPELARIAVDGHTDNVGALVNNLALSRSRALAVARWLIKAGVDERRIEVRGFGPKRPLTTNDSEADRAKNRRVEFTIIRNDARGQAAWSDGTVTSNIESSVDEAKPKP